MERLNKVDSAVSFNQIEYVCKLIHAGLCVCSFGIARPNGGKCTLWDARLYPVFTTAEESVSFAAEVASIAAGLSDTFTDDAGKCN